MPTLSISQRLRDKSFFIAPGVYDGITARLANAAGFDALYMTGYCVSASLGLPDLGLASYSEFVQRVDIIKNVTALPLIADADTGFGGVSSIRRTVRGYEKAGASAIQIEDQEIPRRCGHTDGKRVVATHEMVAKVKAAVDARLDPDTLIIARTDALAVHGLAEALHRCEAYARAGADILFVDAPESEQQFAEIGRAFDVPTMANMVPGGKGPVLEARVLQEMGFAFAIYPSLAWTASAGAIRAAYQHLKATGRTDPPVLQPITVTEGHEISGFPEYWELERRFGVAAVHTDGADGR